MNLIVTSAQRLSRLYGDAAGELLAALEQLAAARHTRGVATLSYFVEDGLPELEVAGVTINPDALVTQLRAAEQALRTRGDRIESLLIIGGPAVIPFGRVANPVPDSDSIILTDWLYGLADPLTPVSAWPVGRLPDAREPAPVTMRTLIEHATARHSAPAAQSGHLFGYSAESWYHVACEVFAAVGDPATLLVAPPALPVAELRQRLAGAALAYFNLHGVRNSPRWYAQTSTDPALLPVLRPADVEGLALTGALVFSQACYGAAVTDAGPDDALALTFLRMGAAAFIGATVLSYGALRPPLGESDLLAHYLLRHLPGAASIGAAFQQARAEVARSALRSRGALDADDSKTLLAFVLYGDPTLPPAILEQGVSDGTEAISSLYAPSASL